MRELYKAFAQSKKLNKQKGFTLIELLVVVAIIAILAAIAIPQFAKYRKNAAISAAQADLQRCITGLVAAYTEDASNTSTSCTVGESTVNLSIDANGNLSPTSISVTVKGQSVSCTISQDSAGSYKVSCS